MDDGERLEQARRRDRETRQQEWERALRLAHAVDLARVTLALAGTAGFWLAYLWMCSPRR